MVSIYGRLCFLRALSQPKRVVVVGALCALCTCPLMARALRPRNKQENSKINKGLGYPGPIVNEPYLTRFDTNATGNPMRRHCLKEKGVFYCRSLLTYAQNFYRAKMNLKLF